MLIFTVAVKSIWLTIKIFLEKMEKVFDCMPIEKKASAKENEKNTKFISMYFSTKNIESFVSKKWGTKKFFLFSKFYCLLGWFTTENRTRTPLENDRALIWYLAFKQFKKLNWFNINPLIVKYKGYEITVFLKKSVCNLISMEQSDALQWGFGSSRVSIINYFLDKHFFDFGFWGLPINFLASKLLIDRQRFCSWYGLDPGFEIIIF